MFPDMSPRGTLHALGLTYDVVGWLMEAKGNINSERYVSIQDDLLWPVIAKNLENKPWIFQDVHMSVRPRQWKETYIIQMENNQI